ncbi:MAG: DUF1501 domain-containing protein [Verrucomicrobia bacterium]|nr:DUF1501 domain-containing protein [Verrucomicrobiota bacterium]
MPHSLTGFDPIARRAFFGRGAAALGSLALGSLGGSARAEFATTAGEVRLPHHAPRAKRVIFLYMSGGPSQFETFDHKPELARRNGQPMPESVTQGQPVAQLQGKPLNIFGPRYPFRRVGQCGAEMTTLLPHLAGVADEMCIVRSMQTDVINHDPAHTFMNTGSAIPGRPSIGSWVLYGLGNEAQDLPGFVVLLSMGEGLMMQPIASRLWHSGFLPGHLQGVQFSARNDPIHYLRNPPGVTVDDQRELVGTINDLNRHFAARLPDPEIAARITQYELAFKMQMSAPGILDFSDEPRHVLDFYGVEPGERSFAGNCLLARRLAERGVRFIQLYHRDWDHHKNIFDIEQKAREVDRASAALVLDLKQRGLLDDTLIVWGGEFGRTPMSQSASDDGTFGRDHHIRGFSMWLAGGGVKPGITHGATDELGYRAVENPVHVHDLHATMLHLLGLDHLKLTVHHQSREMRLTDVAGRVVKDILA